jgi:hypothetical protein
MGFINMIVFNLFIKKSKKSFEIYKLQMKNELDYY